MSDFWLGDLVLFFGTGLSGLITPSLEEMIQVVRQMQEEGFDIPVLIGGATTSSKHTSVKIAKHYDHPVVHVVDASLSVPVVEALLDDDKKSNFDKQNREKQDKDCLLYTSPSPRD